MVKRKPKGWVRDPYRHSLSARGIDNKLHDQLRESQGRREMREKRRLVQAQTRLVEAEEQSLRNLESQEMLDRMKSRHRELDEIDRTRALQTEVVARQQAREELEAQKSAELLGDEVARTAYKERMKAWSEEQRKRAAKKKEEEDRAWMQEQMKRAAKEKKKEEKDKKNRMFDPKLDPRRRG